MTLLQLKYVVEVAAAGTISGAAKKLYIAQPSLTAAIKELEHEIGFSLFTRTNKGVVISPDGETGDRAGKPDRGALFWRCAAETPVLCLHPALFLCR